MSLGKRLLMRAFGRPAGMLGKVGGYIMARGNRSMAQRAIELLDVQPEDRVLEVGFGPGVGIALLAGAASSGWVAGADPSEEMLRQARARNVRAIETGRVELRRGPAGSLPFADGTFDKALSINSMQVWPDAIAGLREIRRVLKPGGALVLGFTRHSGQGRGGLAQLLAAAGFTDVRLVDVFDGKDFCVIAVRP
jgi:ubiquinone/menaquinone biosynthesis C-methylase UbiE